jgi:hypothetical protein
MKALLAAVTLIVSFFLIDSTAARAQDINGALLTRSELRAYHACLFAAWVEDYCRGNAWRPTASWDRVFLSCVAANGGGHFPLAGRRWYDTDNYCWAAARGLSPPE